MPLGPVEIVVIGFDQNRFDGSIVPEVQARRGDLRLRLHHRLLLGGLLRRLGGTRIGGRR